MADDEDDYLSDKFLVGPSSTSSLPKTYTQIRKESQRQAKIKNDQNKLKSRRQLEVESREEGLSKSLFERAKEEEESGIGQGNKALSMMMKMGFKPGQSLGKVDETAPALPPPPDRSSTDQQGLILGGPSDERIEFSEPKSSLKHKIEPLPLNEWAGLLISISFRSF